MFRILQFASNSKPLAMGSPVVVGNQPGKTVDNEMEIRVTEDDI